MANEIRQVLYFYTKEGVRQQIPAGERLTSTMVLRWLCNDDGLKVLQQKYFERTTKAERWLDIQEVKV